MKISNCLFQSKVIFLVLTILAFCKASNSQISQWTSKGVGGGGALFSPSFSSNDPNEIYISCDMSELFKTTDLGVSWNEVDFKEMTGNNGAKVQFSNDPMIRYCVNFENDLITPHKTTNGGINWFPLPGDPTFQETYSLNTDINDHNKIILSSYTDLYLSTNGGNSFTLKYSNGNGCYVAGVFFDGAKIYVGLDDKILYSTNSGSTFSQIALTGIAAGEGMVSFAGAKSGGTTRFVCVTFPSGDIYPGITGADHYSYQNVYAIDWGASWTVKASGIISGDHPFFVDMALNDINIAYLGGGNTSSEPIVYKTTNGGNNWTSILHTNNNQNIFTGWSGDGGDRGWSYGEYALGFDCAPFDANKVMITDLGFPHLTTNGGTSWRQVYLNAADQNPMNTLITQGKYYRGIGLENTSCWWLTWADSVNMFGSYSDIRGTRSTDGGEYWSFNYTGHTFNTMYQCVKHPVTGNLYAAVSSVHDMYQSTYLQDSRIDGGSGMVLYSTNKGLTWLTLHNFSHPVVGVSLDPNNSNRLYASVVHSTLGGIFVSSNIQNGGSSTWAQLSAPPRTQGHPFNVKVLNDGNVLCSYSGRRNSGGTFTASSGIFLYNTASSTWSDRSHSGMYYWTKDVVVDPHDVNQNTWYGCVFSGWGGPPNGLGGLYKTTNRGVNWTKINSLDRVGSCTISPVNPNEMYMSTEVEGLWYSNNINNVTPTFSQVQSYRFRQPERIFYNPHDPNEVWVTSFGNGVKVGYTSAPAISFDATLGIEGFWNGAVQVQDTVRIYLRSNVSPYSKIDSSKAYLSNSGNAVLQFTNSASGNYFVQTEHRNALETWSSSAISFTNGVTTTYNFTTSSGQAFGNNQILKSGRWCTYSGDVNDDDAIDITDIIQIFNDANIFATGYILTDLTGDSSTDLTDLIIAFNNSSNFVAVIKP